MPGQTLGMLKREGGGGGHQQRVYQASGEGRTCNTVEVCYDLGGFMYGPHVLIARSTLDTNVIDEEALKKEYFFDNKIDEHMAMSWRFDLTTCECGIQTQATLTKRIGSLREQIVARNNQCVLLGQEPIQFPVVLLLDNHSSRFGTDVHEALFFVEGDDYGAYSWKQTPAGDLTLPYADATTDDDDSDYDPSDSDFEEVDASASFEPKERETQVFANPVGEQVIRMFSEPPNTSTFLQAIDQIGKQFHVAYDKWKVNYMKTK